MELCEIVEQLYEKTPMFNGSRMLSCSYSYIKADRGKRKLHVIIILLPYMHIKL